MDKKQLHHDFQFMTEAQVIVRSSLDPDNSYKVLKG